MDDEEFALWDKYSQMTFAHSASKALRVIIQKMEQDGGNGLEEWDESEDN